MKLKRLDNVLRFNVLYIYFQNTQIRNIGKNAMILLNEVLVTKLSASSPLHIEERPGAVLADHGI